MYANFSIQCRFALIRRRSSSVTLRDRARHGGATCYAGSARMFIPFFILLVFLTFLFFFSRSHVFLKAILHDEDIAPRLVYFI